MMNGIFEWCSVFKKLLKYANIVFYGKLYDFLKTKEEKIKI